MHSYNSFPGQDKSISSTSSEGEPGIYARQVRSHWLSGSKIDFLVTPEDVKVAIFTFFFTNKHTTQLEEHTY